MVRLLVSFGLGIAVSLVSSGASAITPEKPGTLVYCLEGSPESFNPCLSG